MAQTPAEIQPVRSALLYRAALLVANTPDLNRLLEQMTALAGEGLHFDLCLLALQENSAATYHVQVLWDAGGRVPLPAETAFALEQGLAGQVMRSGKALLVSEAQAIQAEIELLGGLSTQPQPLASLLVIPLQVYGRVFGAVSFATALTVGYDNADQAFASAIATHLALAIDRLGQAQQLQHTQNELRRLSSFPELNPSAIIELDPKIGRAHV